MTHEYNCLMLSVGFTNWDVWKNRLPYSILYSPDDPSYGLETSPHITICYGLHLHITPEMITKKLPQLIDLNDIYLTGISTFPTDKGYTVLKFDVDSQSLKNLNSTLIESFPCFVQFPIYKPHVTIGFIDSKFDTQIQKFIGIFDPIQIIPKNYNYNYKGTKNILYAGNN